MQQIDDSEEEEELIIVLKFPELNTASLPNKTINLEILDEESQILQCNIAGMTFKGKCDLSLGTQLLITKAAGNASEIDTLLSNTEAIMKCIDFGIKTK